MATSIGLAMNPPHTDERAVFTQLKPVRMSGADGAEDSSVFEEVKPAVRMTSQPSGGSPGAARGSTVFRPSPGSYSVVSWNSGTLPLKKQSQCENCRSESFHSGVLRLSKITINLFVSCITVNNVFNCSWEKEHMQVYSIHRIVHIPKRLAYGKPMALLPRRYSTQARVLLDASTNVVEQAYILIPIFFC